MEIPEWPADRPNAKDRLERFSYERCLADGTYEAEHREWFRWASRERARRAAAEAAAKRQAEVNSHRLKMFEQQIELERDDAARKVDKRIATTAAATLRLRQNSRRW